MIKSITCKAELVEYGDLDDLSSESTANPQAKICHQILRVEGIPRWEECSPVSSVVSHSFCHTTQLLHFPPTSSLRTSCSGRIKSSLEQFRERVSSSEQVSQADIISLTARRTREIAKRIRRLFPLSKSLTQSLFRSLCLVYGRI